MLAFPLQSPFLVQGERPPSQSQLYPNSLGARTQLLLL